MTEFQPAPGRESRAEGEQMLTKQQRNRAIGFNPDDETSCRRCGRHTDYPTAACGYCRADDWQEKMAEFRATHMAHSGEATPPMGGYFNCPGCRAARGYAARVD